VIAFDQQASNLPGGHWPAPCCACPTSLTRRALSSIWRRHRLRGSKVAARAALALRLHPEQAVQRLANPGFEPAAEKVSAAASKRTAPPVGACGFVQARRAKGNRSPKPPAPASVDLSCAQRGRLRASVGTGSAREKYLAAVYVRGKLSLQAESKLVVQWKDAAASAHHGRSRADRLPAGGTPDWTRLCVLVEVPAKAAQLVFCVSAYNQGPEDVLQADDGQLQRIPQ